MQKAQPVIEEGVISGRYRVLRELGRGGMGAVLEVVDQETGQHLALKMLLPGAGEQVVALFKREFYTLASLRHANIIDVYEYGTHQDEPFYTMELLVGTDLRDAAPLPWKDVCRCLQDLASTLGLLHARRLLHRDLSPRNVWRTADGTIKLLDFGALASFGVATEVVGTPAFVPPEAVRGGALDQRSDLYMLGALGYWLLTGELAYRAHSFAELQRAWSNAPLPASARLAAAGRADATIPTELDWLLEALLSADAVARPADTAEVVDRLVGIGGSGHGSAEGAAEGYLRSKVFAGREPLLQKWTHRLHAAAAGAGDALLVEGSAGIGRTRLLEELALRSRLSGATVLHVRGQAHPERYGVASALASSLLAMLPGSAAAARRYAPVLGHLSPRIRARLGGDVLQLAVMSEMSGESRLRMQVALRDWFLEVARQNPLVILVDDVHWVDESSVAWLVALAAEAKKVPLLLAATSVSGGLVSGTSAFALRHYARREALASFSVEETGDVLRSVFGQTAHLTRLTERLHRLTQGNPAHCMEAAEHLVRTGVVFYSDGQWVLPSELSEQQLPASRDEALVRRIDRLGPAELELATALSLRQGETPIELCLLLGGLEPRSTFRALEALVREGILSCTGQSYCFTSEALRLALVGRLDATRATVVHAGLGQWLCAQPDVGASDRLRGGVHLLLGGDEKRGLAQIGQAAVQLALVEPLQIAACADALETAVAALEARKSTPHELVGVLSALSMGGYYVHRQLVGRYRDETIATLESVMRLGLARRLRRFVGGKLALVIALFVAGAGFARARRRSPLVPSMRDALSLLGSSMVALAGVHTICVDPEGARRCAQTLQPFAALGPQHVLTVLHDLCAALSTTVSDRLSEAVGRWSSLLGRLRGERPVKGLTEDVRKRLLGGALYAAGVLECWRDSPKALEYAQQLDGLDIDLYEMSADQIRMVYYAHQGDLARFARFQERVELHAIQRGTAWQVETWSVSAAIAVHVRTHNAHAAKRVAEDLQRLSVELPSLGLCVPRARGAHLLLQGKPDQALPHLELVLQEEPAAVAGWARGHALLARAYNELGRHEEARDVCRRVQRQLREEDLDFPAMNLGIQIEAALAEAQLGHIEGAARALDALIARHAPAEGALTLGALHEAMARVALLAGDEPGCALHVAHMEARYRPTGAPTLLQCCRRMSRLGSPIGEVPSSSSDAVLLDTLLADVTSLDEWATKLTQFVSVPAGQCIHLVFTGDTQRCLTVGEERELAPELLAWAQLRLDEVTQDITPVVDSAAHGEALNVFDAGTERYELELLVSEHDDVVGAVLIRATGTPADWWRPLRSVIVKHVQRLRGPDGATTRSLAAQMAH